MPAPHDRAIDAALAALRAGRVAEAEQRTRAVLAARPKDARALETMGHAAYVRGRFDEAEDWQRRAARAAPKRAAPRIGLAQVALARGAYDAALRELSTALRLDPASAEAMAMRVEVLERRGELDAAAGHLERFEARHGTSARLRLLAARLAQRRGDLDGAAAVAQAALERPDVTEPVRRALLLTLGRLHDARGDLDAAFAALRAGNALHAAPFDRDAVAAWHERVRRAFPAPPPPDAPRPSLDTSAPILVVGLPRCGSTLVEQILLAHPDVAAAGEAALLPSVLAAVRTRAGRPYPEGVADLDGDDLTAVAQSYLERLRRTAGVDRRHPARRIVDKSLENGTHLGLFARLLPEATLVHVFRHRMDAGLSCWMQDLVPRLHPWTCDLGDVGWFVRASEAMVAHWIDVLGDRVLHVRYESLVADPEATARRLVAHAGLEWNDACLRPQDARRDVATSSYAQVGEAVHARAVARHERWGDRLAPLREALGEPPAWHDAVG